MAKRIGGKKYFYALGQRNYSKLGIDADTRAITKSMPYWAEDVYWQAVFDAHAAVIQAAQAKDGA